MNKRSTLTHSHSIGRFKSANEAVIPDCLARIKAYLRSLNAAEKKVAKFILRIPTMFSI